MILHSLTLNLLIILPTALSINSECDDSEMVSSNLIKRSIASSVNTTTEKIDKSLEEFLKNFEITDDNMRMGRGYPKPKPPLPRPTEILDELFARRLFNTTMNYIVPLFHVVLPVHTENASTVHLAMQAFLGLFSAIAWISTIGIPLLLTEMQPFGLRRRSLDTELPFSYSANKLKSIFTDDASNKIGLDWNHCLCKTICEAHRDPKRYGLLSVPFQVLFPPFTEKNSEAGQFQNLNKKCSRAAFDGQNSDEDCGGIYHCFFDVLDLTQYLYKLIV